MKTSRKPPYNHQIQYLFVMVSVLEDDDKRIELMRLNGDVYGKYHKEHYGKPKEERR